MGHPAPPSGQSSEPIIRPARSGAPVQSLMNAVPASANLPKTTLDVGLGLRAGAAGAVRSQVRVAGSRASHRRRLPYIAAGVPKTPGDLTISERSANLPRMNDLAEVSDEALMLAYAAGDVAAFERLYQRHRGKLYRFLVRQLRGNAALADEIFQDVWQRVIVARAGWKPEATFGTWLYRIAHNRLTDHWRALQHRPPAPEDADLRTERITDPDDPERQLSDFEERRRLQLALDELPEEQREVILLRLEHDMSLEEIGEATGVGRETVKSRLRYAMDKLRARLAS